MGEMSHFLTALVEAAAAQRRCVVASVVDSGCSATPKVGTSILLLEDGSQIGSLGNAELDADVTATALGHLASNEREPAIVCCAAGTTSGKDGPQILLDPIHPDTGIAWYESLRDADSSGAGYTEVVMLERVDNVAAGTRFLFDSQGTLVASRPEAQVPAVVLENLRPLSNRPRPYIAWNVSYLPTLPRSRLIIVGAAPLAQKTAALAADVDFELCVIDDRHDLCTAERFPTAIRVTGESFHRLIEAFQTTSSDFVVVITRDFERDQAAMRQLVRRPWRYLGLIGNARKIETIIGDLRSAGVGPELLDRIHAPLGLEIGSQTVPEIAISIVAELIAVRNRSESTSTRHLPRDTVLPSER